MKVEIPDELAGRVLWALHDATRFGGGGGRASFEFRDAVALKECLNKAGAEVPAERRYTPPSERGSE